MLHSSFIYLSGLASLLLADVLITKALSAESIARWAEVRALVGISGVVCLVGLEQVLVRSRQSSSLLLRLIALQVPVLALGVGTLVWWLGFLGHWATAVLLAMASAGTMTFLQYFRSHHQRFPAQIAEQGWKILVFIAILLFILTDTQLPLDTLVVAIMLMMVILSAIMLWRLPPSHLFPQAPEPRSTLYAIGIRFMVTSLLLALAVYAEQLVVNGLGTAEEGASYFTHATFFLFPISLANGYLAFLIGPWVRDNHDQFMSFLRSRGWLIGFGAVAYAAVVHGIGWVGWTIVSPAAGESDPILRVVFFLVCIARTLYTFPSAYVGVFGQPHQHDLLIMGQLVILVAVAVGFFFMYQGSIVQLVYIVAIMSAANWVLRTALGFGVLNVIAKSRI
ncbi:MAG: hypothetical protein IT528_07525 [Nitrosomonas sp.]|nr:hypothetical protein [Nitrosomonas sp.]MCC7136226.1 hypothetical protein [Nitrosomonas sp.]